jgi:pyruvate dehydrogenase E1 component alpha subunit
MTSRTNEQSAAAPAGNNGFTLISNEKLLQLYTTMLKCRMIEERARALFSQGGFAGNDFTSLTSVGQEATVVAVAIDLLPEDTIAPSHRDFLLQFIQGESLARIFRRVSASAARPKRKVQSIAAQLDIATEAARTNTRKKNGKVAVAFCGDGAASLDALPRAIDLATVKQLPILFVFQNDLPVQAASLALRAPVGDDASPARTLPWITVDGNDAVAVYRVATEAVTQARKGNGPTLIECKPYSLDRSTGVGPSKSRAPGQVRRSKSHDPIPNMENYLTRKGLYSRKIRLEVAAAFTSELNAATKSLVY